jgi:hypothetical protein
MRGVGNIIVGIVFIIGGLSGQLVLIGTNSGGLLAAAGVGLIIWGIIKMASGGGAAAARPKITTGSQAIVNQEAVVYSQMDSQSARVTKLEPGSKVEVVSASEVNDVQWVNVKLPEGQQGYILGHNIRQ